MLLNSPSAHVPILSKDWENFDVLKHVWTSRPFGKKWSPDMVPEIKGLVCPSVCPNLFCILIDELRAVVLVKFSFNWGAASGNHCEHHVGRPCLHFGDRFTSQKVTLAEVIAVTPEPLLVEKIPLSDFSRRLSRRLHRGFPNERRESDDSFLRKLGHCAPKLHWTPRESSD